MSDRVSDVRMAAAELMAKILGVMVKDEWDKEKMKEESESDGLST